MTFLFVPFAPRHNRTAHHGIHFVATLSEQTHAVVGAFVEHEHSRRPGLRVRASCLALEVAHDGLHRQWRRSAPRFFRSPRTSRRFSSGKILIRCMPPQTKIGITFTHKDEKSLCGRELSCAQTGSDIYWSGGGQVTSPMTRLVELCCLSPRRTEPSYRVHQPYVFV